MYLYWSPHGRNSIWRSSTRECSQRWRFPWISIHHTYIHICVYTCAVCVDTVKQWVVYGFVSRSVEVAVTGCCGVVESKGWWHRGTPLSVLKLTAECAPELVQLSTERMKKQLSMRAFSFPSHPRCSVTASTQSSSISNTKLALPYPTVCPSLLAPMPSPQHTTAKKKKKHWQLQTSRTSVAAWCTHRRTWASSERTVCCVLSCRDQSSALLYLPVNLIQLAVMCHLKWFWQSFFFFFFFALVQEV